MTQKILFEKHWDTRRKSVNQMENIHIKDQINHWSILDAGMKTTNATITASEEKSIKIHFKGTKLYVNIFTGLKDRIQNYLLRYSLFMRKNTKFL